MNRSQGHFPRQLPWIVALLLLVAPGVFAAQPEYHLTGIITSTGGKQFAADGQQRLLREGDSIGEAEVVAIYALNKTVRLRFPGGEVLIGLQGSAQTEEADADAYSQVDFREPSMQRMNSQQAGQLARLAGESEKLGDVESSRRLNQLLGLPKDARILTFEHEEVASTRSLLDSMAQRLPSTTQDEAYVGKITVSSGEGDTEIYLTLGPGNGASP
jgi:hypothetical protein